MRVIAAIPVGGLVVGAGLGVWRPDVSAALPSLLLVLALTGASLALTRSRSVWLAASVALGAASSGVLLAQQAWHAAWRSTLRVAFESMAHRERAEALARGAILPDDERAAVVLVGVLREDASPTSGGAVSLRVSVQWIGRALSAYRDPASNPVSGDVLLTVAGETAAARMGEWRRGRRIRAPALLRRPTRYLDPGVVDQERLLARRGISLVGSVKSGALVDVLARGSFVSEAAASARAASRRAMSAAVGRWSPPAAAIVTAIVIGDRTGLDAEVERRLQEAGTYHVIAISGGNIAILAGLALLAFRAAGFLGRTAMVAAIALLLMYSAVVSGGASVDRATLMAVVYLSGRALDLRGPPMNALVLVAGLLVAARPLAVVDPGLLLTFGASAAIIAVGDAGVPSGRSALARSAIGLGLASLAAEAALLPVGTVFFSRVTFAGLVLNFVAVPAMAITQVAGMAAIPLWTVSEAAASVAGWIAAAGAAALVRSATLVDLVPQITWRVPAPSPLAIAVYYAGGLAWWAVRCRMPAAACSRTGLAVVASAAAVWIVAAPWTWMVARGDGRLHVTFLDVGQGDAVFVRFPRGHTMLVDAGGAPGGSTFDIGDRVVGQALRTLGIARLDTVALTHGDADHIGGAASIVGEFRPWDVWEGIPVPASLELQALQQRAERVRARWTRVRDRDEMAIDGVRVVVHHPVPADWERQKVRNDDSIVIELRWGDVSFVLTGDIGADVERQIAAAFEPSARRVLKVAHHGSLTSSAMEFLQALRPDIAVISVGRTNTFGHPAPAVLKRYEAIGASVYRTDRNGAITITTDGQSLEMVMMKNATAKARGHEGGPEHAADLHAAFPRG